MSDASHQGRRQQPSATTERPGTRPYEPQEADVSLPELISRLSEQSSNLFRQEITLAKTEIRQEVRRAGRAGGMFGGAAVAGLLALLLLSLAAAWALGYISWLNTAWGLLIVGVVYAIVAGVLAMTGRNTAQQIEPLPETQQSLKEDAQWAKNQPK